MSSSSVLRPSIPPVTLPVILTIRGRDYSVTCPPGEEKRLQTLAALVDERMTALARAHPNASDIHLLALIALILTDELEEARTLAPKMMRAHETAQHEEEEELLVTAVNHLRERLTGLAHALRDPIE